MKLLLKVLAIVTLKFSDLSHSEFKPSDSEESEQKEEEGGEEEVSIDLRNWTSMNAHGQGVRQGFVRGNRTVPELGKGREIHF